MPLYNQQRDGQFRKPSDNTKLRSLIPKYKFVPIEVGLTKTIEWFSNSKNLKEYKADLYNV